MDLPNTCGGGSKAQAVNEIWSGAALETQRRSQGFSQGLSHAARESKLQTSNKCTSLLPRSHGRILLSFTALAVLSERFAKKNQAV